MNDEVRQYVNSLTLNQMVRWICLIEGVSVVLDTAERLGVQEEEIFETKQGMNTLERSLMKYIRDRFSTVKSDVLIDPSCYDHGIFKSLEVDDTEMS